MLYHILVTLLVIDSFLLLIAILLQAAQGGGLAATFGGVSSSADTLFGSRQTSTLLTKASWWCGGLFMGLAFILSLASSQSTTPQSVLDNAFQNPPVAPATQGGANSTNPVVPLPTSTTPATKTSPDSGKR